LRVAARCLRGGFGIYSINLHDWMEKYIGKSWMSARRGRMAFSNSVCRFPPIVSRSGGYRRIKELIQPLACSTMTTGVSVIEQSPARTEQPVRPSPKADRSEACAHKYFVPPIYPGAIRVTRQTEM
jgi:hypothetical protein